ncbi:MAG: phosphopantetheine-binding protein, partial [Oscillospiraceae bacterium]
MIFETIRKILAQQLDINETDITMESLIVDDLGADSLDVVDLV